MLLVASLLACMPPEATGSDSDSGPSEVDTDTDEGLACTDLELRVDGPEAPVVGDTWGLTLRCDDATLTGTLRFYSVPASFASFDGTFATFLEVGDGELWGQAGTRRTSVPVTVSAQ